MAPEPRLQYKGDKDQTANNKEIQGDNKTEGRRSKKGTYAPCTRFRHLEDDCRNKRKSEDGQDV